MINELSIFTDKGALAQESYTGSQLVSPTESCKKKMDTSTIGSQNIKLSTLVHIKVSPGVWGGVELQERL
jgi:hypothetical protein